MSFDSFPFWAFLLLVWIAFLASSKTRHRKILLVAASFFFYATWGPLNTLLLLGVAALTDVGSRLILRAGSERQRKQVLSVGVIVCVGCLVFFKYRYQLAGAILPLDSGSPGREVNLLSILPPLGISYFVFQTIGYLLDCYRGQAGKPAGLLDCTLFLSFFPHLPAGPILRGPDFLPQLRQRLRLHSALLWESLLLICFGLFKKLVIADNLSLLVNPVFDNLATNSGSHIILATYAYAVQIYCDFSGYTDLAIGIGLLFGYRLPENFRWPYLARSPADFWRRWHISLTTWLRDYVYFSLPGLRSRFKWFQYGNIMVTMVVCGLWHGVGWMFLLWGFYHGCLLVGYRAGEPIWRSLDVIPRRLREIGSILVVQQLVVLGWILFRVNKLSDLSTYVHGVFQRSFFSSIAALTKPDIMVFWLLVAFWLYQFLEWRAPLTRRMFESPWNPYILIFLVLLGLAIITFHVPSQVPFIYFRF